MLDILSIEVAGQTAGRIFPHAADCLFGHLWHAARWPVAAQSYSTLKTIDSDLFGLAWNRLDGSFAQSQDKVFCR